MGWLRLPTWEPHFKEGCPADRQRPLQRQEKRSAQVAEKRRPQRVLHSDPATSKLH